MQKILEYEKKLIAYRMELNSLIQSYNMNTGDSSELIAAKIEYLEKELEYINKQLSMLKSNLNNEALANNKTMANYDTVAEKNVVTPPVHAAAPQNNTEPLPYYLAAQKNAYTSQNSQPNLHKGMPLNTPNSNPTMPQRVFKKKSAKDYENLMGKSLMGIFASILIFLSMIFFATIVFPFMSDTIKVAAMFIVSFIFLTVGLLLLKKDVHSKLYLSITGCGLGALYISLLISNIFFHYIGDFTLYAFILCWAIFVCVLSKQKSKAFQIIGHIGIVISIIFGCILCNSTDDWNKLLFLAVFFIITESIFFFANITKEYGQNIVSHISQLVCLLTFAIAMPYYDIYSDFVIIAIYSILLLFILANIFLGYGYFSVNKKSAISFGIINALYTFLFMILFVFPGAEFFFLVMLLLALFGIEYKFDNKKHTEISLLQCFYMILSAFCILDIGTIDAFDFITEYVSIALLIIPFAIYGYYSKDKIYKICSIVYLGLFILQFDMNDTCHFLIGLGIFALFAYLLKTKGQYETWHKALLYCMFLIFMLIDLFAILDNLNIHGETDNFIVFTIISCINLAAIKTPFVKNWENNCSEKDFIAITNIVNAYLMSTSVIMIETMDNLVLHILTILVALALFMVNSTNLLNKKGIGQGIYVGIKFTIYMITILTSFDAPRYGISICCFIFAILSIICGFWQDFKSLRIYGLGLALLSIAKLILMDIAYDNTIGRAFSFFVCGILCFVISTIYNYVDKKMSK